jgi:hypothetical protein
VDTYSLALIVWTRDLANTIASQRARVKFDHIEVRVRSKVLKISLGDGLNLRVRLRARNLALELTSMVSTLTPATRPRFGPPHALGAPGLRAWLADRLTER